MQTIPLAGQRSDLPSDPWPSTPPTPPALASPAPAAPFAAPTAAPRGRRPHSAAQSRGDADGVRGKMALLGGGQPGHRHPARV